MQRMSARFDLISWIRSVTLSGEGGGSEGEGVTSLAAVSRSAFLSVDLKASSVLVLYRVPLAEQQYAGVGPSL